MITLLKRLFYVLLLAVAFILAHASLGFAQIATYDFNECSGSELNDASGHGNYCTITSPSWSSCSTGQDCALNFDGSGSSYAYGTLNNFNSTFTITGWVYLNTPGYYNNTWLSIGSGGGPDDAIHLRVVHDGTMRFGFGSDDLDTSSGVFSFNTWHFLEYTYDSGSNSREIFVDGSEVAGDNPGNSYQGDGVLYIGEGQQTGTEPVNGMIEDVNIYSSSDLSGTYSGGSTPSGSGCMSGSSGGSTGPIGYWRLNECSGSIANNSSSCSSSGTLTYSSWDGGVSGTPESCALGFAGSTSVSTPVFLPSNTYTETAWVSPNGTNNPYGVMFGNDDGHNSGDNFYVTGAGNLEIHDCTVIGGCHDITSTNGNAGDGSPHFVAVSVNNGTPTFYIDGGSSSPGGTVNGYGTTITLGGNGNNNDVSSYYHGDMNDACIFNTALDSTDIGILVSGGSCNDVGNLGTCENFGGGGSAYGAEMPYCNEDSSLQAWYLLDDGGGTTTHDSSGNNYSGDLNNSPSWLFDGQVGDYALNFTGSSDQYVQSSPSITTSALTVSAWVNVSSNPGSWTGIFSGTNGSSDDYQTGFNLDLDSSSSASVGDINFECDGSNGSQNLMNAPSYSFGTWIHVAVVSPDAITGDATLYVNGVAQSHRSGACSSMTLTNLLIGARQFGGTIQGFFNGTINDVRIYNRALSPAEIAALYNYNCDAHGKQSGTTGGRGLLGWWKLNDGSGTSAADSSGNSVTGTLNSGSDNISPEWAGVGQIGSGALHFDGTTQYVDLGTSINPTSAITVSAWVYSKNFNQGQYIDIVSKEQGGYVGWTLRTQYGAADFSIMNTSADNQALAGSALTNGVWHHLVGTWNGTTSHIYVDGKSVATKSVSSMTSSPQDIHIGDGPVFGRNFTGFINDVRIYNYALSADEVQQLYSGSDTQCLGTSF